MIFFTREPRKISTISELCEYLCMYVGVCVCDKDNSKKNKNAVEQNIFKRRHRALLRNRCSSVPSVKRAKNLQMSTAC